MIVLRTVKEIEVMKRCNEIAVEALERVQNMAGPGVATMMLDQEAEAIILKRGARPAFKGYRGFPRSICTSINDEVVHGIPGQRILREGDVVSIDLGVFHEGYYGDCAISCAVGQVSESARRLLTVTEEALYKGIEAAHPDSHLNDIGAAIEQHVEKSGFSVVREFVGHGIGQALHEEPQVPNFGVKGTGLRLKPGMVLAIEPMVNEGRADVRILNDGWTAVTVDGKLSAHFEHSIAVTEDGPVILSQKH